MKNHGTFLWYVILVFFAQAQPMDQRLWTQGCVQVAPEIDSVSRFFEFFCEVGILARGAFHWPRLVAQCRMDRFSAPETLLEPSYGPCWRNYGRAITEGPLRKGHYGRAIPKGQFRAELGP